MMQLQHTYRLLGSEVSLFTGKIRAYLRWKGIPFEEVIASDAMYKSIILPGTGVSFIPVLLVCDRFDVSKEPLCIIQDTKEIMDYFENQPSPSLTNGAVAALSHPVVPSSPQLAFASMICELLADEWLVLQAMYWRWGEGIIDRQRAFIAFEFGRSATGGVGKLPETLAVAEKRMPKFAGFLPSLGISSTTGPTLERQFHQLLAQMSTHFEQYPFLLGHLISLADFAFYGSFYAHLSRDPVPSYVIKTEAPLVYEWVERVGGHARYAGINASHWDRDSSTWKNTYQPNQQVHNISTAATDPDIVPASASHILSPLLQDYLPILRDTIEATLKHLSSHRVDQSSVVPLPRALGRHEFQIGLDDGIDGASQGERMIYTHAVWIFDRILDRTYRSPEQVTKSDSWLLTFDSDGSLLQMWKVCTSLWCESGWRIRRRKNKLVGVREDRGSRLSHL